MSERPRQLRQNNDNRWDFLAGVLPHRINPTDIDLVFERRGRFLVLEGKRMGATFGVGQRLFYDRMSALPQFTVIHFYGDPPEDVRAFGFWGQKAQPGTTAELQALVARWFAWVEAGCPARSTTIEERTA